MAVCSICFYYLSSMKIINVLIAFLTKWKFNCTNANLYINNISVWMCLKSKYRKWKNHRRQNKNRVSGLYILLFFYINNNNNNKWTRIFVRKNRRIELRASADLYNSCEFTHIQELSNWMSGYEYFVTKSPHTVACFARIFPTYW